MKQKKEVKSLADIITFGKYKGFTVREAIDDNPRYVEWIVDNIPFFCINVKTDSYLQESIDKSIEEYKK